MSPVATAAAPAVKRGMVSGAVAGLGTSLAAGFAAKMLGISPAAPINSVSHVLWGDKSQRRDRTTLKYTLTGFLINQIACLFWAALYEKLFGKRAEKGDVVGALAGSALISAVAYGVDYLLVPRRAAPGFEKRLPPKAVALVYAGLALALAYRGLAARKQKAGR